MLAVLACFLAACGAPVTPVDAGMPPAPDAAVGPVTLWGELSRRDTGDPLPDTQVCVLGASGPCVHTDATGLFTLEGVPPNAEIELELAGDTTGLVPLDTLVVTHGVSDFLGSWAVLDDATRDAFLAAAMETWDASTTGVVTVDLRSGGQLLPYGYAPTGLEHATAALEGGPPAIYADAMGVPDPRLVETSSSGFVVFINVAPGDYVLTFSHASAECVRDDAAGWPSGSGDALRVHVVAGAQVDAGLLHCAAR
jgi:hypothetical protein